MLDERVEVLAAHVGETLEPDRFGGLPDQLGLVLGLGETDLNRHEILQLFQSSPERFAIPAQIHLEGQRDPLPVFPVAEHVEDHRARRDIEEVGEMPFFLACGLGCHVDSSCFQV